MRFFSHQLDLLQVAGQSLGDGRQEPQLKAILVQDGWNKRTMKQTRGLIAFKREWISNEFSKKWKLFRPGFWNITTYHDYSTHRNSQPALLAILGPPRPFGTAEFAMWPICFTAWSSSPVDVDIPRAFSRRFMASMSEAHVCVWVTPEFNYPREDFITLLT